MFNMIHNKKFDIIIQSSIEKFAFHGDSNTRGGAVTFSKYSNPIIEKSSAYCILILHILFPPMLSTVVSFVHLAYLPQF